MHGLQTVHVQAHACSVSYTVTDMLHAQSEGESAVYGKSYLMAA